MSWEKVKTFLLFCQQQDQRYVVMGSRQGADSSPGEERVWRAKWELCCWTTEGTGVYGIRHAAIEWRVLRWDGVMRPGAPRPGSQFLVRWPEIQRFSNDL